MNTISKQTSDRMNSIHFVVATIKFQLITFKNLFKQKVCGIRKNEREREREERGREIERMRERKKHTNRDRE